ncbi:MAG: outer membrane protein assembly factor BamD [Planctomycetota bacterium]
MNFASSTHRGVGALLIWLGPSLVAAAGLAQTTEFRLGEDRQWERTASPDEQELPLEQRVLVDTRRLLAEDLPGEAFELIDPFIENEEAPYPAELLPEALLLRGDALLAGGREFRALYDYERVARDFPRSPQFAIAIEREFDIAQQYLGGLRRRFFGLRLIDAESTAIELLIRAQERLPGSRLAERANITMADYYYDQRRLDLAGQAYEVYLANHPRGEHRTHARQRLIYTSLARFKGPRYDTSVLIDAEIQAERFNAEFPLEAERAGLDEGLLIRIDDSRAAQLLDTAEWYLSREDEPSARYVLYRLLNEYPASVAGAGGRRLMEARGWTLETIAPAGVRDLGAAAPVDEAAPGDVTIEGQLEDDVEVIGGEGTAP